MAAAAARADWRAHSSASSRRPPRPPRAPTARAASLRAPGPSSRAWKSETTRLSVRGADTLGADQRWWGGGVGGRYQPGCPPGDSAEVGTRPPALAAPCPPDLPARPTQAGARLPGRLGDGWGWGRFFTGAIPGIEGPASGPPQPWEVSVR